MSKGCNKCGSLNLEVNGLFYVCGDCGDVDDSTYGMVTDERYGYKKLGEKK